MLAGLVFGLFGLMHLMAAIAFALDKRARVAVLQQLLALRARNALAAPGTAGADSPPQPLASVPWVWALRIDPVSSAVGRVGGSLVALCALIGMPIVRLRAAVPDCVLEGSLQQALGRPQGLSAGAIRESAADWRQALAVMYGKATGNGRQGGTQGRQYEWSADSSVLPLGGSSLRGSGGANGGNRRKFVRSVSAMPSKPGPPAARSFRQSPSVRGGTATHGAARSPAKAHSALIGAAAKAAGVEEQAKEGSMLGGGSGRLGPKSAGAGLSAAVAAWKSAGGLPQRAQSARPVAGDGGGWRRAPSTKRGELPRNLPRIGEDSGRFATHAVGSALKLLQQQQHRPSEGKLASLAGHLQLQEAGSVRAEGAEAASVSSGEPPGEKPRAAIGAAAAEPRRPSDAAANGSSLRRGVSLRCASAAAGGEESVRRRGSADLPRSLLRGSSRRLPAVGETRVSFDRDKAGSQRAALKRANSNPHWMMAVPETAKAGGDAVNLHRIKVTLARGATGLGMPQTPPQVALVRGRSLREGGSRRPQGAESGGSGGTPSAADGPWVPLGSFSPESEGRLLRLQGQELFASSALAIAFAYTTRLLPVVDLARRQVETARFLRSCFGVRETSTGVGFNEMVDRFKIMIGPDNMRMKMRWWPRARLWRRASKDLALLLLLRFFAAFCLGPCIVLPQRATAWATHSHSCSRAPTPSRRFILLQDRAGFWEPSEDLAVALMAQKIRPENIVREQKGFLIKKEVPMSWEENPGGGAEETPAARRSSSDNTKARGQKRRLTHSGGAPAHRVCCCARRTAAGLVGCSEMAVLKVGTSTHACCTPIYPQLAPGGLTAVKPVDATCPLSGFDADAVEWSVPASLRELKGRYSGRKAGSRRNLSVGMAPFNASRVWATVLSVTALLRLDESWLVSREGEADETLIDRAMAWLHLQEQAVPELARLLIPLFHEAESLVADSWELVQDITVRTAREEQMRAVELHRATQLSRAAGHVATRSLMKHETASCFTAPPTDGVLRYQRVMVYLTAVLAMLTVEARAYPRSREALWWIALRVLGR